MKSRNLILTIALAFIATFTYAQTNFGGILIGGTAGLDVQFEDPDNVISIDLQPQLGFFVLSNLAIGGDLTLAYSKVGDFSSNTFGISPFARYYFGEGGTRIFLHAQAGYITSKIDFGGGDDSTIKGSLVQLGPGVAFFLNDHVAIEGILAYSKSGGDFDTSQIGLRFGVQAYLGGK